MSRAMRLAPVQQVAEDNERRLAQRLATAEQRVKECEQKLSDLKSYQTDYERQFSARAATGIGAMELRDYQVFLARLGEAIKQQRAVQSRAEHDRDADRRRWQQAAQRAKAIDHVVDRWRADERKEADQIEQREIDELGLRRYYDVADE